MKKVLPFLSFAVVMAACNANTKDSTQTAALAPAVQQAPTYTPDTAGLAQFQEWKAQNELSDVKEYQQAVHYTAAAPVKKATKKAVVHTPARKAAPSPVVASGSQPSSGNSSASTVSNNSEGTVATTSEAGNEAKAAEKKGWSKAAKGTAIGAGVGAVAGAVINKNNRTVGGVVGGVVGGAVGYGIGRVMDKKDGRY